MWKDCPFFFLAMLRGMQDLSSPDQGLILCPLQWKLGALTTGLPGKSLERLTFKENFAVDNRE